MVPREAGPGLQLAPHHARPGGDRRVLHAPGSQEGSDLDVPAGRLHRPPLSRDKLRSSQQPAQISEIFLQHLLS